MYCRIYMNTLMHCISVGLKLFHLSVCKVFAHSQTMSQTLAITQHGFLKTSFRYGTLYLRLLVTPHPHSVPCQLSMACYHPSTMSLFRLSSSVWLNGKPSLNLGFTQRTHSHCCTKLYDSLVHKHTNFSELLVKPFIQRNYPKNRLNDAGGRWLMCNLDNDRSPQPPKPYPGRSISTLTNSMLWETTRR